MRSESDGFQDEHLQGEFNQYKEQETEPQVEQGATLEIRQTLERVKRLQAELESSEFVKSVEYKPIKELFDGLQINASGAIESINQILSESEKQSSSLAKAVYIRREAESGFLKVGMYLKRLVDDLHSLANFFGENDIRPGQQELRNNIDQLLASAGIFIINPAPGTRQDCLIQETRNDPNNERPKVVQWVSNKDRGIYLDSSHYKPAIAVCVPEEKFNSDESEPQIFGE